MPATRKIPVSFNPKKPADRGEFVVPQLTGNPESAFIGIKTGRLAAAGALSYTGMDVTPEILLDRFCERQPSPPDRTEALRRLRAFVEALQVFRIGNILSVTYAPDGLPILHLDAEFVPATKPARLP